MRDSRLIVSVLLASLSLSLAADKEKRAPSGFTGVRGKKSVEDTYRDNNIAENANEIDKRVPSSGFMGMRGKKLLTDGSNEFPDLPKRAPSGFMGMRGKKEYEFVDDVEKRAPQLGFLGMRGKKDGELYDGADDFDGFNPYKRAPSGFMGMRGKKEYVPVYEEDKRAPASGFFGMRGKKQPGRSSFFGMRGKKYPYEFRGKFVGVRGKKGEGENEIPDSGYVSNDELSYLNDLDMNQLMYLLAQTGDRDEFGMEKRKGPSGFLGMRG